MRDFYMYILQVNAGLVVFYLLYRVLTAKDTFFGIHRFFLLSVLVLAFTCPLVTLAEWLKDKQPLQAMIVDYSEFIVQAVAFPEISAEEKTAFTADQVLLAIWGVGSVLLFLRFLVQLGSIVRLRLLGKVRYFGDTRIIVLEHDTAPFSFFNWIFVDPRCYQEKELQGILIHEKAHVTQGHSWDTLIGEVLCIFFWFNPGVWLIRREIRQNLEFLADKGVLSSGYDRKDYQYHLLRLSNQSAAAQIINNFNVSQLKKRIMMMNRKKVSRMRLVKYAMVLPVTGLLILAGNARTVAEVTREAVGQIVPAEQGVAGHIVPAEDNWKIKGRVTNEQGENMSGVTVTAKVNGKVVTAVVTNPGGEYFMSVTGESVELHFFYPGMVALHKTVKKGTSTLDVVLKAGEVTTTAVRKEVEVESVPASTDLALDQVVVTGVFTGNDDKKPAVAYTVLEEVPQFPGGEKAAAEFIARNVKYPQYAAENGIQGTVQVSFVIDKDGHVSEANVLRGVDGSLDAEAVRVVRTMPQWKPGKKSGKAVNARCSMPITFNLLQETPDGMKPLGVKRSAVSVSSSSVAGTTHAATAVTVKAGQEDTYYVTTKDSDDAAQYVSFSVSSAAGKSQSSVSPALYRGAVSQINLDDQIVILNGKLVEDVKELPQDLSQVEELSILNTEGTIRKMNKKYGKNARSVLIIKSK